MGYLRDLRRRWGTEFYEMVKSTMARPVVPPLRYQAPSPLECASAKIHLPPSIENISINVPYLETTFGGQGLAKRLPEGYLKGRNIAWRGFSDSKIYVSAQEKLEECKIMVTYVIQCGGTGFVKIGKSNRVGSRLSNLQSANPHPLEILVLLPDVVGFREEDLHYRFRGSRDRGEWFRFEKDLEDFVKRKIRLRKGPMDLSLVPTHDDLVRANVKADCDE